MTLDELREEQQQADKDRAERKLPTFLECPECKGDLRTCSCYRTADWRGLENME